MTPVASAAPGLGSQLQRLAHRTQRPVISGGAPPELSSDADLTMPSAPTTTRTVTVALRACVPVIFSE